MRRRLLATGLLLATACAVACGRSGADFLDEGGTSTAPTPTGSPTATVTGTPGPTPVLVVSEVFVRDNGTAASNANLSSTGTFEPGGDDRFIEIVNLSIGTVELGGVRVSYDGNGDGVFADFHVFAAASLAPGKVAVVFNDRGGVDLTAIREDAGPDAVVVESNGGYDLQNDMSVDEPALAIRLHAPDGDLLYHWEARHESDEGSEEVRVRAGTTTSDLPSSDVSTEPETCNASVCDGVYSLAVESPTGVGQAVWKDHREVGVPAGTSCSTAAADACCRFSPGRYVAAGVCQRF